MAQKSKDATIAGLRTNLAQLEEVLDGAQMRLSSYEAKLNGQEKRIEGLLKNLSVEKSKVEGWKQIALELIEERKDISGLKATDKEYDIAT